MQKNLYSSFTFAFSIHKNIIFIENLLFFIFFLKKLAHIIDNLSFY